MGVEALATVEALEVRLGRSFQDHEKPRAEAILHDVSALALGQTKAKWNVATVPPDVAAVVLSAALRTFKNPDRYIQQQVGSWSARLDRDEVRNGVFTKPELDVLTRNSQDAGLGLYGFATVSRTRDEGGSGGSGDVEYWETNQPGSPIPYSEKRWW